MKDRFMKILEKVANKILSGRFICLVMIIFTYCFMINKCVNLLVKKMLEKDIVTGLIVGLASSASMIITFYYLRSDRKNGGSQ